jgi:dynein heavy chain, axonemal
MIETCKLYITCRGKETIWSQPEAEVKLKLEHCIQLNQMYHSTYLAVKNQPFLPGSIPFGFSENYVFGKFDTFCARLSKIITLFDIVNDYEHLFERRMEGLLLGEGFEGRIKIQRY